jgi:hypothetical protein
MGSFHSLSAKHSNLGQLHFPTLDMMEMMRLRISCLLGASNTFVSYRLLSKKLKIKIHKTLSSPVVLYGCETWSLTPREHRLRVSENRVLRRIFGHKKEKVAGGLRRMHIEEFRNLYASTNRMLLWSSN